MDSGHGGLSEATCPVLMCAQPSPRGHCAPPLTNPGTRKAPSPHSGEAGVILGPHLHPGELLKEPLHSRGNLSLWKSQRCSVCPSLGRPQWGL